MKNKWFQKVLCLILSVTLLLASFGLSASAASQKDSEEDHPYSVPSLKEMETLVGSVDYRTYIEKYETERDENGNLVYGPGPHTIPVNIHNFTSSNKNVQIVANSGVVKEAMIANPGNWTEFGDYANDSVYLPAEGSVTWTIDELSVEEAGLYYIKIDYFSAITDESSVSAIERGFRIDNKIPFSEVSSISLSKDWVFDNIFTETKDAIGKEDKYEVHYSWGDDVGAYYKVVTSIKNGVETVTTYKMSQDYIGNSMAPAAKATATWNSYFVQDDTGYHSGYFKFYLSDGPHTITFQAERDPVIIRSIQFVPANDTSETLSYEDYLKGLEDLADKDASAGVPIVIEGEFPDMVSDSSVSGSNDNTSAITTPVTSGAQLYNVIGETGFSSIGQWAAYKFRVTDTGFYNFGMRFKQNTLQGMYVCRTLKLSGGIYGLEDGTPTVPFDRAYNARFTYADGWQSSFVSDGSDPFLFYFEEGVDYTLYLECSLGTLKEYIEIAETALSEVNSAYLRIIQLTGTDPDEYNDSYDFFKIMPDVLITILQQAKNLKAAHDDLMEICGNGSHIATLETIYKLFDKVGSNKGRNIAANLSNLKSYLGTLGTWINDSKSSTVMIDSITIAPMSPSSNGEFVPNGDALPEAEANFFHSIWFEITAFFASFFTDYDQMGLVERPTENAEHIDVWLASGRDQSQIWRTMIDAKDGFTDTTGVSVALKLVTGGTLLPSILSRKGPDVYLGLGSSEVINYAIRDAVLGVNGFDPRLLEEENSYFTTTYYTYFTDESGYKTLSEEEVAAIKANPNNATDEYIKAHPELLSDDNIVFTTLPYNNVVEGNFAQAAIDTVTISPGFRETVGEDGTITRTSVPAVTYGIPRTMQFSMMFYRMDVLAGIGHEVPESWDDLLSILPVLQANNMQIGVSYIAALDFMIYQEGGSMWKYTDSSVYDPCYAGAEVAIDSNIALSAFDFTCRLYSDYSFPVSYDAANRFRTGEMPIIIGSYADVYNQLVVYATEIAGLWSFCSLPGSYREDEGVFNYDSLAQVTATIILNGADSRGNLREAWQFTQWETAAAQQAEFGNRIVAIMGPSAKYETSNLKAIDDLSWTASEKAAIMNQMDHMSSIVNYPGSYIITRYTQFAFLDAVNEGANAVEAMQSYIPVINSEIARKRKEFGLWYVGYNDEKVPPQKNVESGTQSGT